MALTYQKNSGSKIQIAKLTLNDTLNLASLSLNGVTCWNSSFAFTLLEDDTWSIRASDATNLTGEVEIPSAFNGKAVTVIEAEGFKGATNITSLYVPDTITNIGEGAFSGCASLVNMSLPFVGAKEIVGDIAEYPLGYIFGTTSYEGGVQTKQTHRNANGGNVEYVSYIPETLKSVTIRKGSNRREDSTYVYLVLGAFENCSNITNIILPDNIASVQSEAFRNCSSLVEINIPDSVTLIGGDAFNGCSSLTRINIPDGVTLIGNYAFYGCSSLTMVIIPYGVTTIYNGAFSGCSKLTIFCEAEGQLSGWEEDWNNSNRPVYYYSENSPTTEGNYWHYVNGEPTIWKEIFTFTELSNGTYEVAEKDGASVGGIVDIPSSYNGKAVTKIADDSFTNNIYINGANIPDSIIKIGARAFSNCEMFGDELVIPSSVIQIGELAFNMCPSLRYVTINEGCSVIGKTAFANCGISELHIPSTVYLIGEEAFSYHGNALEKITVAEGNSTYHSKDNCLIRKSTVTVDGVTEERYTLILGCKNSVIPDYVTSIGAWAFTDCEIPSVVVPITVVEMESNVLADCPNTTVYVEAESKPDGWADDWVDDTVTVVWGYTETEDCTNGHDWDVEVAVVEPTCSEQGYTIHTCNRCGEVMHDTYTDPLGHDYADSIVEPDCDDGGYTLHTCRRCGYSYYDNLTDPTNLHNWSDWTIDIEPTCTDEGSKTCTCIGCGRLESQSIPMVAHTESDWIIDKEPTTEEEGSQHKVCTVCGMHLGTFPIPKLEGDVTYLTDESGNVLTDESGNLLTT